MRHLQPALIACLLTLGHPALAHDATPGNSAEVSDCTAAVAMVSRSDVAHCEAFHNNDDACLAWASDRKTTLRSQVGELCAKEVHTLTEPGGCKDQGKELRILYHRHKGLPCTAASGCDARDGRPAPHDHTEFVHVTADCN